MGGWHAGTGGEAMIEYLKVWIAARLFGARLFKDGNMWCVLRGANLQEGIAGFGRTPFDAFVSHMDDAAYMPTRTAKREIK